MASLLIPALSSAREMATSSVCLGNQKGLIIAWQMYAAANDDKLVNGRSHPKYWVAGGTRESWVATPLGANGNYQGGDVTMVERLMGLHEGKLGPYTGEATELYHCPGDNRNTLGTRHGHRPMYLIYRSYSFNMALSAYKRPNNPKYTHGSGITGMLAITQLSDIRLPSMSAVIVEEAYDGGSNEEPGRGSTNFNDEYWNFTGPTNYYWWDPLAQFHRGATTFSFADGHAELHKWEEPRTVEFHKDRFGDLNTIFRRELIPLGRIGDSVDMDWMIAHCGAKYLQKPPFPSSF